MRYFAYGSNMLTERLRARVSSAQPVGRARLLSHSLHFHKRSEQDGSSKGDAYFTGNEDDVVWGVIFEIADCQKPDLDRCEGLGHGYEEQDVTVIDSDGNPQRAYMYVAAESHIAPALHPYTWYKRLVVDGAREHGLPDDYVAEIEAVNATEDPDRARAARNAITQKS